MNILLIVVGVIFYFLTGLGISMAVILWDYFMPDEYSLMYRHDSLENHCIKLAFAWPIGLIFYAVQLIGFLLLIVIRYTIKPFDNYLKRKR